MSSLEPGRKPSASCVTVFISTGWQRHPPNLAFLKAKVFSMALQHASDAELVARHDENAMIISVVEFWIVSPHCSGDRAGTPKIGAFASSMTWAVICAEVPAAAESRATTAVARRAPPTFWWFFIWSSRQRAPRFSQSVSLYACVRSAVRGREGTL